MTADYRPIFWCSNGLSDGERLPALLEISIELQLIVRATLRQFPCHGALPSNKSDRTFLRCPQITVGAAFHPAHAEQLTDPAVFADRAGDVAGCLMNSIRMAAFCPIWITGAVR